MGHYPFSPPPTHCSLRIIDKTRPARSLARAHRPLLPTMSDSSSPIASTPSSPQYSSSAFSRGSSQTLDTPASSQERPHAPSPDVFGPVVVIPTFEDPPTPALMVAAAVAPPSSLESPFTHEPLAPAPRRRARPATHHNSLSPDAPPDAIAIATSAPASGVTRNRHRSADGGRILHPYARLYEAWAEEAANGKKRRQWTHALEHHIFTREELRVALPPLRLTSMADRRGCFLFGRSKMRAAQRRRIYISSLEAHIDRLHNQLIGIGLYPVPFADLVPFKGMSAAAAKPMLAGLQQDVQQVRSKQTEIERAVSSISRAETLAAGVDVVRSLPRFLELECAPELGSNRS